MGHMRPADTRPYPDDFWAKNGIGLVQDEVKSISPESHEIILEKNGPIIYDKLILALGSIPALYNWPGQNLNRVSTLYSWQDLTYIQSLDDTIKQAVVVGGGLIGIEMAEMLHSRGVEVTMLVREESYSIDVLPAEESALINDEILSNGIRLRLAEELVEIRGKDGGVSGVLTNKNELIDCDFVGLCTGVRPRVGLVQNTSIEVDRGIIVDDFLMTNHADIYAIGDCAQVRHPQPFRKSIEPVWYTGRMMGETVGRNLTGQTEEYNPGIWFNSAKYLNLEYQVYGQAPAQDTDEITSVISLDNDKRKSLRIYYSVHAKEVMGIASLGIRLRQRVAESWIKKGKGIEEVMKELKAIFFDPEFFRTERFVNFSRYNLTDV